MARLSEQCSKADRIKGLNNLGNNKSFLCGLTEFKSLFQFAPDILGGFNLRPRATSRWDKRTGIHRRNPRFSVNKRSISQRQNEEAKVTMLTASQGGRDRTSISFEFCGESLERFVHGLAMNPREHYKHFVLEVCVFDTRYAG